MTFEIENVSDIPATILFKEHGNLEFNFDTHQEIDDINLRAEQIYFNPTFYQLQPNERKEITVQLKCGEPEVVRRMFKIDIVDGTPVFFHVHAII